ncbi:MAG TPA: hypothetical protein VFF30_16560 [Nitrososphaerales archaeon]|nr:hypothetical protein [Nitrososphaerales archaeon]
MSVLVPNIASYEAQLIVDTTSAGLHNDKCIAPSISETMVIIAGRTNSNNKKGSELSLSIKRV